jgi:negative regulator of sigma E activity
MISDKGKAVRCEDRNGVNAGAVAGVPARSELLESLSALMDDEVGALEIRRVVKAIPTSDEYTSSWRRYHAVRASLHHDVHQRPAVDLLPGVRAALAAEQAASVPTSGSIASRQLGARMLRWSGQLAIAASVAAAVLVGYPVLNGTSSGEVAVPAVATTPEAGTMPALNGDFSASPLTRTVSLDDAARLRLEKAVRNFSGTSAVINADNTPMFRNQLQPFSVAPVPAPADANSTR